MSMGIHTETQTDILDKKIETNNKYKDSSLAKHFRERAEDIIFKVLLSKSVLFSIRVFNEKTNTLDLLVLSAKDIKDAMPEIEEKISLVGTAGGQSFSNNRKLYVGNIKESEWFSEKAERVWSAGYKSMLALPFYFEEDVIGVIQIYTAEENYVFDDSIMLTINVLCEMIASVIVAEKNYKENLRLQRQLHHAEKHSLIGKHAAQITHHVNNVVDTIIGGLSFRTLRILNDECKIKLSDKEKLEIAKKSIFKIFKESTRIVKDLRDILRYGGSLEKPLFLEKVGVFGFVYGIVREFNASVGNGIVVELAKGNNEGQYNEFGDIDIVLSKEHIKSVMLELFQNAKRAIGANGTIFCYVYPYNSKRKGRNSICIEIINKGIIKKEDLESIFDPFFTTSSEGTGHGLPGAKVKVLAHNGALKVYSNGDKVPKGQTSLRVYIPFGLTSTK
jgi:signal transduction histidine kinase